MIAGTPEDVGVDDLTNDGSEMLDEVFFVGVDGQTADEDRTTVDVVLAKELFVGVGARDKAPVLHIEGIDAITVIPTDSLREQVSMLRARSDVA
jgi:hypothetical protein